MSALREVPEGEEGIRDYPRVQAGDGRWYLSCEEVHAFLAEYLAGELAELRRREFDRHLERCSSCLAYLESYRATLELAHAAHLAVELDADSIPPDLVAAILAARG